MSSGFLSIHTLRRAQVISAAEGDLGLAENKLFRVVHVLGRPAGDDLCLELVEMDGSEYDGRWPKRTSP